jgi:glycosyltransferase 2 family protein
MRWVWFFLKALVSVSVLGWVVQRGSLSALYHALQGFSLTTLMVLVALESGALLVSAVRWKLFLPEQSLSTLVRYTLVGQLYAVVLPGQLAGDVMKTVRLSYGVGGDTARITSSVLIDKISGFLGVIIVLYIGLVGSEVQQGGVYNVPALLVGGVLLSMVSIGVYAPLRDTVIRFLQYGATYPYLSVWCRRIEGVFRAYAAQALDRGALSKNLALGCMFQLLSIAITMVCAHALGISVGFFEWCWIFGVISLAVALPITVAGIGVREGLFVYYLVGLGVAYNAALALSVSILAIQGVAALIGGLCEVWSIHSTNRATAQ